MNDEEDFLFVIIKQRIVKNVGQFYICKDVKKLIKFIESMTHKMNERKVRNYGLDLARIYAMLAVVILHILGAGGVIRTSDQSTYPIVLLIEILMFCAVDILALLSGWLGIRKKKYSSYRVIELILITVFYLVIIAGICFVIEPSIIRGIKDFIKLILGAFEGGYWYIACYIPLALIQPFVNKMLLVLSVKQHQKLCWVGVIVTSVIPTIVIRDFFGFKVGYSFVWLLECYIIGAYLYRKYSEKEMVHIKQKALGIYLGCAVALLMGNLFMEKILGPQCFYFIQYTSPIILLMGISVLFLFNSMNIKKAQRGVMLFSSVSFDIYIIHCHPYVFEYLIRDNFKWIANVPVYLIPFVVIEIAIIGYIGMALIGKLRIVLFEKAKINIGCKKLALVLDKILYSDFKDSI